MLTEKNTMVQRLENFWATKWELKRRKQDKESGENKKWIQLKEVQLWLPLFLLLAYQLLNLM